MGSRGWSDLKWEYDKVVNIALKSFWIWGCGSVAQCYSLKLIRDSQDWELKISDVKNVSYV
jgi:hypothetical protein